MITVTIEPGREVRTMPDIRSVHALLNRLGLGRTSALVIRGSELLTPDRPLAHGDELTVRIVTSRG